MRNQMVALGAAFSIAAVPLAGLPAKPPHPITGTGSPSGVVTTSGGTTSDGTTSGPTGPSRAPTVMYVLHGSLSAYTAATATSPGTVSITVSSSNFEAKTLDGTTLTVPVTTKTHLVLGRSGTVAKGDLGIVKVRAAKLASAKVLDLADAFQVIDLTARRIGTPSTTSDGTTSDGTTSGPTGSSSAPTVMYVLHGSLSAYTAATATSPGTVSITVSSSNFEAKTLRGTTLAFQVTAKTHLVLGRSGTVVSGDLGIVKVRVPKAAGAKALGLLDAFQVIDLTARR